MFVVNLALSDCGIMLTQGPLMFINAFYDNHWMWGPFLCKLYGCTGGIFGNYVYSYYHHEKVSFLKKTYFFWYFKNTFEAI